MMDTFDIQILPPLLHFQVNLTRVTKRSEEMFSLNPEPLLKSVLLGNEPPTEDLAADDEGPDFMSPKRRNRRPSKTNKISVQKKNRSNAHYLYLVKE